MLNVLANSLRLIFSPIAIWVGKLSAIALSIGIILHIMIAPQKVVLRLFTAGLPILPVHTFYFSWHSQSASDRLHYSYFDNYLPFCQVTHFFCI